MKITKETAYIMVNEDGMRALAPDPGEYVEIELSDGTYHAGQVSEVTGQSVTLSERDGDHIYDADDITDYKSCGFAQTQTDGKRGTLEIGGLKLQ